MKMGMDEDVQDGFAFAIPDLYKTSNLAHLDAIEPEIEALQPLCKLNEEISESQN